MIGALGGLVTAMVATVIPMEALLFTAIDEQETDTDCAQAVVESIAAEFWRHPVAAPRDYSADDFGMSVAEIHELLERNGIENRAFWMEWDDVIATIARYGPVIVHFDRPAGHFAVAVGPLPGRSRGGYHLLLADPARGTIIVSAPWWKRHASGATVVVNTHWDREVRDGHIDAADARLRRLELARDGL